MNDPIRIATNDLIVAGNKLSFAAQTAGGTAGQDERLMQAVDTWAGAREKLVSVRRIVTLERDLTAAPVAGRLATPEASADVVGIVVNGVRFAWSEPTISHEQICELADQPVHASATYSYRVHGGSLSGVTYKGKKVSVFPDMEFTAVVTGSA